MNRERFYKAFFFLFFIGAFICMGCVMDPKTTEQTDEEYREELIAISQAESEKIRETFEAKAVEVKEIPLARPEKVVEPQEESKEDEPQGLFLDELLLLQKCVEAEAGNQDILGRRLVVDVILNRVDSPLFPDDIISVIMQDSQFSVVANGMIDIVEPSETTIEAVNLELEHRIDFQILFFRAGHFHSFCVPAYQHGDHYFGY